MDVIRSKVEPPPGWRLAWLLSPRLLIHPLTADRSSPPLPPVLHLVILARRDSHSTRSSCCSSLFLNLSSLLSPSSCYHLQLERTSTKEKGQKEDWISTKKTSQGTQRGQDHSCTAILSTIAISWPSQTRTLP